MDPYRYGRANVLAMPLKLVDLRFVQSFLSPTYVLAFLAKSLLVKKPETKQASIFRPKYESQLKGINGMSQRRKTSIALHLFSSVSAAISSC